jgi:hypothetical protein
MGIYYYEMRSGGNELNCVATSDETHRPPSAAGSMRLSDSFQLRWDSVPHVAGGVVRMTSPVSMAYLGC